MATVDDVDELIEQYHLALGEFVKGDPEPVKELFSRKDDVTLANPLGPPALGGDEVAKTLEHAATTIRDGEIIGFEIVSKLVTPELAYVLEIERQEAKVGADNDVTPFALRATMIFRPEESPPRRTSGNWNSRKFKVCVRAAPIGSLSRDCSFRT